MGRIAPAQTKERRGTASPPFFFNAHFERIDLLHRYQRVLP
jgi:hypothetical protein